MGTHRMAGQSPINTRDSARIRRTHTSIQLFVWTIAGVGMYLTVGP